MIGIIKKLLSIESKPRPLSSKERTKLWETCDDSGGLENAFIYFGAGKKESEIDPSFRLMLSNYIEAHKTLEEYLTARFDEDDDE